MFFTDSPASGTSHTTMVSEVIVVAFRNAKMKGPHIGKAGHRQSPDLPSGEGHGPEEGQTWVCQEYEPE